MAARTWETDFRYAAIRESIKAFNHAPGSDLFNYPGSLCLPVAEKPIVGWTPGRIFLICLVLGFALLVGGAVVMSAAEQQPKPANANDALLMSMGICLGVIGISLFCLPVMLDRFIMKAVLGSRGTELAGRPGDLVCAEISDIDRAKMTVSIDGDDYVLLLADPANQRLLIEGVAARYLIRAKDVTDLRPFQFMNYVGAEITFRIGDETTLSLAIARVSWLVTLGDHLPVPRRLLKNRVFAICASTLR